MLPKRGRVLILSYHCMPENVPSVFRVRCFHKYLRELGYAVEVIGCSTTPWANSEANVEGVRRTPDSAFGKRFMRVGNRAALLWEYHTGWGDYGACWRPFGFRSALEACNEEAPLAILSSSPPAVAHLVALDVKLRRKVTWVADFQDPMVGNPFLRGWLSRPWCKRTERAILRRADLVLANTDAAAAALQARYPEARCKIETMFNGYDPEEECGPAPFPPRPHRVLAHVGSIYGGRKPDLLLGAVNRLIARGRLRADRIRIRFTGPFDETCVADPAGYQHLRSLGVLEMDTRNVPRLEALQEAATADFLAVLDVNAANTSLQVPSKLYDYLRIGRPILAVTSENSPVQRILARAGVPYRCAYTGGSPEQAETAVLELQELPSEPVEASSWFRQEFNARNQAQRLAAMLEALGAGARP
jgi:glycosyltransferase involved in cell wall biosynthesis